MNIPDLRNMSITTGDGKHVCDTSMLKGEAKDSLSGTNVLKQFTTSGSVKSGTLGGEANYSK